MLSFIAERAAENATALVRPDGARLTYGALAMAVAAVRQALDARVGDVAERVVALAVADLAGFVAGALAVLEAGGVLLPLDGAAAAAAIEASAIDARAVAIIVGDAAADELQIVPGDAARVAQAPELCLVVEGESWTRAALAGAIDATVAARRLDASAQTTPRPPLPRALVDEILPTLRAGGTLHERAE